MNPFMKTIWLLCVLSLSHSQVFAEIYEWTDNDGTVHFSDRSTKVPKGKKTVVRQDGKDETSSTASFVEVRSSKDKRSCVRFDDGGLTFVRDVVVDANTGLMWSSNGNIAGKAMGWQEAREWVRNLNYGGHNDWRLPTKDELTSFAKRGGNSTIECFKLNGFTNFNGGWFWSSSEYNADYAWGVSMYNGSEGYSIKNFANYVWPVRFR
ncbi:MAG: DUF1566 domain-containing protein [Geobacter sp.]|nr:DUF1566 domain-containing protein [Geobacter sp.]